MKVGYFVETPVEHNLTGGVRSFLNLMEVLVKKGVEPYVVTSEEWAFTEKLSEMGISFLTVTMLRPFVGVTEHVSFESGKYIIKSVINKRAEILAYRWLLKNKVEIVHVNSQFAGIVGNKVAKRLGKPCVYHLREFLEEGFGVKFYDDKLLYEYVATSDALVGISQSVKEYYEKLFATHVNLVYNGLPVNVHTFCKYTPRFTGKRVNIAIVGRVTEAKGQKEAVLAIERLVKHYQRDNILLHIIGYEGKDVYEIELKNLVNEKGLENNVEFHEFMSRPIDVLKDCDIGVLCSQSEAFGRVTVEYMLASLFTIGSNTGGTLEIIDDKKSGLLYCLGNPWDLAEKINWALTNQNEANEIIKYSQERAIKLYSIESTAQKIIDIYQEVKDKNESEV